MLEAYGALRYSSRLNASITVGDHIPAGSPAEIEIRAGTIVAADLLHELTGLSIGEIDWALWFTRKKVTKPYHLTLTADY